jgi:uncharacterized membrane protein
MRDESVAGKWERVRVRHIHDHPPVLNINRRHDDALTAGERIADRFAEIMGSWTFIIIQSLILCGWITLNALAYIHHWDPYPFILLNWHCAFRPPMQHRSS